MHALPDGVSGLSMSHVTAPSCVFRALLLFTFALHQEKLLKAQCLPKFDAPHLLFLAWSRPVWCAANHKESLEKCSRNINVMCEALPVLEVHSSKEDLVLPNSSSALQPMIQSMNRLIDKQWLTVRHRDFFRLWWQWMTNSTAYESALGMMSSVLARETNLECRSCPT